MILGVDILRGGHPLYQWNFRSVGADTEDVGKVKGFLQFVRSDSVVSVPLVNSPAGLGKHKGGITETCPDQSALIVGVGAPPTTSLLDTFIRE